MKTLLCSVLSVLIINSVPFPAQLSAAEEPKKPEQTSDKKDPSQDAGVRKLSRRERKDAIARLDDRFQEFLKSVEYIMLPTELNTFLLMETDEQRDLYIEDFWKRRDPDPRTGRNEYRDRYEEYLTEATQLFKSLSSDRARVFLTRGRPDDRLETTCDRYLQPLELWYYYDIPGIGREVTLLFYKRRNSGEYKLWIPFGMMTDEALKDLVSEEAVGQRGGESQAVQWVFKESGSPGSFTSKIEWDCKDGKTILSAIFKSQQSNDRLAKVWEPPKVNEEDISRILRSTVISNPAVRKFSAELKTAFPGKRGGRTAVQMSLSLNSSDLQPKEIDGMKYYNIDLTGEVLRDGRMFETYRYKYDLPVDPSMPTIVITLERFLRAADYSSRIRVTDVNSGAEAIVESALNVPEYQESAEVAAMRSESNATVKALQSEVLDGESRIRMVPLPDDLLTGLHHVDTIVTGDRIRMAEFYLDGRKIMSKRKPPFSVELDLGNVPQVRRLKVVGRSEDGEIVSGDELIVNAGTEPFRVRIRSPRVAVNVVGPLRVEIESKIPEDQELDRVELWLNETKMATMFNPPFVHTINVPGDLGIAYVRAVAVTKGEGATEAEDVVFINSPEFLQQVDVHLVELPTTVISRGRPVTGLTQDAFTVIDEGTPVKITKFEFVENLPLSIGLAIDTSGSMRPRIAEAQKAGAEFFHEVLRPRDKAFIVSFDTQPLVMQPWTKKFSDLNAGLSSLRAEEATALYDAVVYSLYQFQGVKGQKALIVISDGKDTASRFSFDQALEYAKRSGVPIYGIGIGIKSTEMDVKYKFGRFAAETGGAAHYIDNVTDLSRIYAEIQKELRSQYLLGFYPPEGVQAGSKWREVKVDVKDGKAKTLRGYYP